ncbi:hypothetical protein TO73_2789 (plasmid) [Thermus aquaticus Y51MC23]|uniref:Uncharacterized protein n=1 Tax=Thermus aquaticus (strain ATCC BAA-2747 / Y51MC23) TaxID=498848 RepID=A0ABN4IMX3_THEA5|nr:hypothetical protein TO73_2789 [Thermus aquaticus Y51MC23]
MNGRLEPLNTRGGGAQKAPLSFGIRVFPLWGPRTPDEPRKGKGRALLGVGLEASGLKARGRSFQGARTAFERLRWG